MLFWTDHAIKRLQERGNISVWCLGNLEKAPEVKTCFS